LPSRACLLIVGIFRLAPYDASVNADVSISRPRVTADTVETYFSEYGWTFETLGPGVWRTGFRGDYSFFTIFLRLTDTWLYMTITPFVPAPEDRECRHHTYEAMLYFNREMNLAKFALDEDNDVTLTVELPVTGLSFEVFSEGLTALAYYADDSHPEMLEIAKDARAVSRFESLGGRAGKSLVA
jgi:Putative bacterial sensory transduction regulator